MWAGSSDEHREHRQDDPDPHPEDRMYPSTQDAVSAEIAYRQSRLAADYRAAARTGGRWHRPRRHGRRQVA